jgi:hypothetical protein
MSAWEAFGAAGVGALVGGGTSALIAWRVFVHSQRGSDRQVAAKASTEAALRLKKAMLEVERQAEAVRLIGNSRLRRQRREELFIAYTDATELNAPLLAGERVLRASTRADIVVRDYVSRAQARDVFLEFLQERASANHATHPDTFRVIDVVQDDWHMRARMELCGYLAYARIRLDFHVRGLSLPAEDLPDPTWPDETTPEHFVDLDEFGDPRPPQDSPDTG